MFSYRAATSYCSTARRCSIFLLTEANVCVYVTDAAQSCLTLGWFLLSSSSLVTELHWLRILAASKEEACQPLCLCVVFVNESKDWIYIRRS